MNTVTPTTADALLSTTVWVSPAAGNDAEVIAACNSMIAAQQAHNAIYNGPSPIIGDDAAANAAAPYVTLWDALLPELERLRATTAEGIAARAVCLAVHNPDRGFSFDYADAMTGRLLDCLLRDALALQATRGADTNLMRLGAECDAAVQAERAAWPEAETEDHEGPATVEANRRSNVTSSVVRSIATLRATTDVGIAAKVRAYAACMGLVSEDERKAAITTDEQLLVGIRDDLAAMSGSATPTPSADADLLDLFDQHARDHAAVNRMGEAEFQDDKHPVWLAYQATYDQVKLSRPQTLEGLVAKARPARLEEFVPKDGDEDARHWSGIVVRDLLRLFGGRSA